MSWETVRTIDLGYDQMLVLKDRRGTRVRVLHGSVWLTEEGAAGDYFPASGEEVALKSRGVALLEALGAARVRLIEPRRQPWRARFVAALRTGVRRLAAVRLRGAAARAAIFAAAVLVSLALLEAAIPRPPLSALGAVPPWLAKTQAALAPAHAAALRPGRFDSAVERGA